MSTTVSYGTLLRENRNFRFYWGGQVVSQLGDWFSTITVQALLLTYTGTTTSVAAYLIAAMLPPFLLAPVAGVVVDRLPRKAVMIGADVARAIIALGLLGIRGPETAWVAYVCMAGISSFSAFFEPARVAILPNITSDEELVTANALSSVTWSLLLTSGALLGGLVGRFAGPDTAFIMNSLSFLLSAVLFLRMRVPAGEPRIEHGGGWAQVVSGFGYMRGRAEIAGALTAKLGWGLAGGIQVLIPVYGARVFPLPNDPAGQLSISLLFAAGGVGTALGPILARRYTGRDVPKIRWAIAISFVMGGIYYIGLGFAPNLAFTAIFLLLARCHGAVIWVFSTILLQVLTEDRYRGRVFAAEMSLFTGTMMLSSLATAQAIDQGWLSVSQVTLVLAVLSLVTGVAWVLRLARGGPPRGEPEGPPSTARAGEGSGKGAQP
jgi:MFS family permease